MRLTMLMLAAVAAVALLTSDAQAWSGYGRSSYGGGYGSRSYSSLSFGVAATQIKAKHSRYGKASHPRSYYNTPVYYPPRPVYYPSRSARYQEYEYEYYGRGSGYRR